MSLQFRYSHERVSCMWQKKKELQTAAIGWPNKAEFDGWVM